MESRPRPIFVRENRGDDAQLRELVFGCPIGQGISLWHQISSHAHAYPHGSSHKHNL